LAILRNPLYIGEVRHKGERFPGLHEPIIDHDLWDRVQEQLDGQWVVRHSATNAAAPSPQAGNRVLSKTSPRAPKIREIPSLRPGIRW